MPPPPLYRIDLGPLPLFLATNLKLFSTIIKNLQPRGFVGIIDHKKLVGPNSRNPSQLYRIDFGPLTYFQKLTRNFLQPFARTCNRRDELRKNMFKT